MKPRRCTCPFLPPGHTPQACRWRLEAIAFGALQLSLSRRNGGEAEHREFYEGWVDRRLAHFEGLKP